jgi:RHS repeat-associated protein
VSGALVRSYGYDSAGNSLTTGATTHTYYNNGRMKTAKLGAASATTYTYNALGQRVKKNGPGGGFYYVYDEAGHLQGEYTSGGGTQEETVWLGDTPIATLRPNGSGGSIVYYVHTDQLNTPRKVTNNNSALTVRWTWDSTPFGEGDPIESPGGLSQFKYNLRFPGQMFDAESGLNYNYFRDYDPAVGRYVESDPIGLGGGINTYAYVKSNPIDFVDTDGQVPMRMGVDCYSLRQAVVSACKETPRRCSMSDLCPELRRKVFLFLACALAQGEYTRRCFPNDPTHLQRISNELADAEKCVAIMKVNCPSMMCPPTTSPAPPSTERR